MDNKARPTSPREKPRVQASSPDRPTSAKKQPQERRPTPKPPSDRRPAPKRGPLRRAMNWVGGTAMVVVCALITYVGWTYFNLDSGVRRSNALEDAHGGAKSLTDDLNILVMGLDSRLDIDGKPLPKEMYQLMHTGNETIGGMNTNVLMLLHIPANGKNATVIQIPRDNFVEFPGCPNNRCDGKIKEAYGSAFDAKTASLKNDKSMSDVEKHKQGREAGRAQEIKTVEKFLGPSVRINAFIEVTMVAFYQLAKVVQPIQVCLKQATKDSYSGADFKAGKQEISAEQAVAFVRQRRDQLGDLSFTDLDRERRQQAFIASLAHQLKQKGTFVNPVKLNGLVGVAKDNIVVDGLNLLSLGAQAPQLADGKMTFYTLPIQGDFIDKYGGWSNKVDIPVVQATVAKLLAGEKVAKGGVKPSGSATPTGPKPTVNVMNASGQDGAGTKMLEGLAKEGYGKGSASTSPTPKGKTLIEYAPGQGPAAEALATSLGVTAEEVSTLPAGTMRVVIGIGFHVPAKFGEAATPSGSAKAAPSKPGASGSSTSAAPLAPKTVGGGGKNEDTSTGAMTALSGGGIPCVK
ncbi:Polyisoprenyl-teichoic acid--peptidoglycan teichoic acid transferase TagU [Austwickia sp. TVS 96-490-7B]|uniref:LCP family protein n=1 Tax=Austwickia sp. TVS 96-490-7B TaxID=2830843 RepID=UPI001C5769D4|nr:LCP family protein [Austwickia sp. TVS 96-490-7B]MBW3085221.1 Polyisoprenyl-teichoic acid--peptidoglycan teichoic acid transferase TagU [Austwickia sp. TVS 96-490-7B]